MRRSLCAFLLTAVITANPCLAQITLTPEETAKYAAREREEKLRYIQSLKEQLAREEGDGKPNLAADTARLLAYEDENPK